MKRKEKGRKERKRKREKREKKRKKITEQGGKGSKKTSGPDACKLSFITSTICKKLHN